MSNNEEDSVSESENANSEMRERQQVEDPLSLADFNPQDDVEGVQDGKAQMTKEIQKWEQTREQPGFDPVPTLKALSEILEHEFEIYMRKDPDPLDNRHPHRLHPSCLYGSLLKGLLRREHFMDTVINAYLTDNYFTRHNVQKSSIELNIHACRLLLIAMPGLETSASFQTDNESLINRIYSWAEDSVEPLQSYATGLLAFAMNDHETIVLNRDNNMRLVPKMLKRLRLLQGMRESQNSGALNNSIEHGWAQSSQSAATPSTSKSSDPLSTSIKSPFHENSTDAFGTSTSTANFNRMYIPVHPHTIECSEMLIVRYLTTMAEFQEFLAFVFENDVMGLIFKYIENLDGRDTCLAFEVLRYLASLLCHKKFALEFIARGGLEHLLKVPKPSTAATGVSITIFSLANCEEALERICAMPAPIIRELIDYALWILKRTHDIGKCHAIMFFGLCFRYKKILTEFDIQDGLRKLFNVISVLKILNPTANESATENEANDDVEFTSRQMVRNVCVALNRYMEAHFYYKYTTFLSQQCSAPINDCRNNVTVAAKLTLDQIMEQIYTLQSNTSVRAHWEPVENFLKLGGVKLLLKVISFSYEWQNTGRPETIRSALDVISICCVISKVYAALCERLELPDEPGICGINSILSAAAGEITSDADVQKSALAVLCVSIGAPIIRLDLTLNSTRKQRYLQLYQETLEKLWNCMCCSNGIIVLISLMQVKSPITDADCIRGMACRALAGLARSERVRQIISKLPLFTSGQLQTLMRDPILQEKRSEHVIFQKYAIELLELVSGKTNERMPGKLLETSLSNMHKASVIAQTKIQYNDQQLYLLIYEYLESKGLTQTARMLRKEGGLQQQQTSTTKSFFQSPFSYKVFPSPTSRVRNRSRIMESSPTSFNNEICASTLSEQNVQNSTLIKLRRIDKHGAVNIVQQASLTQNSLQKQTSASTNAFNESAQSEEHTDMTNSSPKGITLNTIVTEYLINQHALCENPVTTCPQFDLFVPHKCPDPKPNRFLNHNSATRYYKRIAGFNTTRLDRHFVHTNFASCQTIRSSDYNDVQFACCDIMPNSKQVVVGTKEGEVKVFNISDGAEQYAANCHSFEIDSVRCSQHNDFILTTCSWNSPASVLWSLQNNELVSKLRMHEEFYCEFANTSQDRVVATNSTSAVLYDVHTGLKISTFKPSVPNNYLKNRATLCATDELLLSDGVLWDVRSGREIHKFDKFNKILSGSFHPNCLEIVSNTEVWDLRTFHLLRTVPVLDKRIVRFSPMHVIYGIAVDSEEDPESYRVEPAYESSFNVLDSIDYSSIATIDVKRPIYDLSLSSRGDQLCMVEKLPDDENATESVVKIYMVGAKQGDLIEEEEDDNEPDSDGSESGSEESVHMANVERILNGRRGGFIEVSLDDDSLDGSEMEIAFSGSEDADDD